MQKNQLVLDDTESIRLISPVAESDWTLGSKNKMENNMEESETLEDRERTVNREQQEGFGDRRPPNGLRRHDSPCTHDLRHEIQKNMLQSSSLL